jgi:hypothetical protein
VYQRVAVVPTMLSPAHIEMGSTVESWEQIECYRNSDTLSAVSLQTTPAGTHTVRFNSVVGDASTYSHSLLMTTA